MYMLERTNIFLGHVITHGLANLFEKKTAELLKMNDFEKRITTQQGTVATVPLFDLKIVFSIWFGGIVISFLVFLVEMLHLKVAEIVQTFVLALKYKRLFTFH